MDMFSFLEAATTPKVEQKPWMAACKFTLGTAANINDMVDACIKSGLYGLDLECSGLDNRIYLGHTVDSIAGFCLSPDGYEGYYIPIAHDPHQYDHVNVPASVWRPAMKRLIESEAVAVFHNGKFDQEFLQFNGGEPVGEWDSPKAWEDTLILAYLRNSRARSKGLKALVYTPTDADETAPTGGPGLGLEMIELHELWGHPKPERGFRYDFTTLDPSWEPALWYAASDAICTLRLYKVLAPTVVNPPAASNLPNQRTIYIIEKACITATRWMERNRIYVDMAKVHELVTLGQQEWFDSIMDIYQEALKVLGRDIMPHHYRLLKETFTSDSTKDLVPEQLARAKRDAKKEDADPVGDVEVRGKKYPMIYDVNAPTQLGTMFEEMGVQGLKFTDKSGQVKTNKDALDEIIEHEGAKFPFMAKIKRFRETWKALSTYLYPMLIDCDPTDHTMKINFQGLKVDTGRFSTPASGGEHIKGVPKVNLQSIPATYDPKRPKCMTRARECVAARPGRILFAADFAGEELRLATNFSKEPKWLTEFFRCSTCNQTFDSGVGTSTPMPPPPRCPNCGSDKIGDIHTLTTLSVYGAEAPKRSDWKELRQKGKRLNFAMAYGGGGNAAMRAVDCDKNEGWRIKQQFDGAYPGLRGWWTSQHVFAKKYGYVLTAFGRKYPVPDIYSSDGGFRSKAERNAVNGPVQGTGADICKIAMGLIHREFKKRGWLERARMIVTMHDELVFEVEIPLLEEVIEVTYQIMTRNEFLMHQNWKIPLTSDVEIGYNWSVPWDLNAMRAGEVRFIGNKKYKDKADLPAGVSWENLPSFPADLEPHFQRKTLTGGPVPTSSAPSTPPPTTSPSTPPTTPPASTAPTQASQPESVASQEAPMPEPAPVVTAKTQVEIPTGSGEIFAYRIQAPLTMQTLVTLADLIRKCRGGGTQELRLYTSSGEPLDDWRQGTNHPPVFVNAVTFHVLAVDYGLA